MQAGHAGDRCYSRVQMRGSVLRQIALFGVFAVAAGCGRIGYELQAASRSDDSHGAGGKSAATRDAGRGANDASVFDAGDAEAVPTRPCVPGSVQGVADECAELPELPATPLIDGLPDCQLPVYPLTPVGWTGDAAAPDAVAAYAVAWRPNGLYFYVRVTDPTPVVASVSESASNGDGVELFVDSDGVFSTAPSYDNPGARRFVIAAPTDSVTPSSRGEVWVGDTLVDPAWASTTFRAYPQSFGYVVEAFVTARDLGLARLTLESAGRVGWDLGVNVSFASPVTTGAFGHRQGQYFFHAGSSSPEADVGAFCRATLDPP